MQRPLPFLRLPWCLCLLMALCWAPARGQDLIGARAFWHEPCAPVALAQVQAAPFEPFQGVLAQGYGPCAVWLRLRVQGSPPGTALVLRVQPTFLDEVTLFDPAAGPLPVAVTGDRYPPSASAYRSLSLQLPLASAAAPRDVYLRVQTSSSRMVHVQALPFAQAVHQDRVQELTSAAYLAVLALTLLMACIHWLRTRERVIGLFALKQVLALFWSAMLLGYGRVLVGDWVDPGVLDLLTSALVVSFTAASVYFDRQLLHEYRPPRWGVRLLLAIVAVLPLQLLCVLLGQPRWAVHSNAALAAVAMCVTYAMVLLSRPPHDAQAPVLPRGWLVALYTCISVLVMLSMLTQLGLLPGRPAGLYALHAHGLLTGVGMLALLGLRAHRLGQRQAEVAVALALAQQLAQRERVHREDREQLLAMLTHELKTPLAVMRLLLGSGQPGPLQVAQMQRALTDMNDVVERCAQADLLHGNRLQAQRAPFNLRAELEAIAAGWQGAPPLSLRIEPSMRHRGTGLAMVDTDPQLLRIVLANLLDNARKYGPPEGSIALHLQPTHEQGRAGLVLVIANLPGDAGWPDAQQLFRKYYRSPEAQRQTGSGLGLYLVAGLVQLLGGRIAYQPTPTQVCFRLWLPS